ncbi:MAG: bifunctional phosphoribosylaminoimidazolecarboxamide formyltransferase/IMP cyclohydrolase [Actinobacteria bacterium]|nr:bifunctional phosphoribosylaminoimidazolecarboxamide formyltransferase/IMP cyclohydrolase [Actinomycetota bacterium]
MVKVRRAIISVSDKKGLRELGLILKELGVEIISTGGTAKYLKDQGIDVIEVSEVTGFPEMLDGRVKTLHPAILGAILADRSKDEHLKQLNDAGIKPIDMVVCNLYPFKETILKPNVSMEEAIEQIDIGGVTLIRAAAKNYKHVAVVVDPMDYGDIARMLKENDCTLSEDYLISLAKKAFMYTADYDDTIYEYFKGADDEFPDLLTLHFEKMFDLRYGENPHQKAAFYRDVDAVEGTLATAKQLHGKELSYNNILDLDAAWRLVNEFQVPAVAIIKHNNPCGVGLGTNTLEAYSKAFESDPVSAYGGIIAINRPVDEELAKMISENFYEVVAAPAFLEEALEILTQKKNLRIMYMGEERPKTHFKKDIRRVCGGVLVQDYDVYEITREDLKVVTDRKPTEEEIENMLFAWKVVKHVKSNAIVVAKGLATVGIGAGQMSRIDSVKIAIAKAGSRAENGVLASDAFFPFADSVEEAAKAGISAIIQPGGSIRDQESIDTANRLGIAMVLTGIRHFRH